MKSNSVDQYILRQEGEVRIMMEILNDYLCVELHLSSTLKYGIPFYMYDKKMVCYLHKCKNDSLDITFWQGKFLVNDFPKLEPRDRKLVASLNYDNPLAIDFELIHSISSAVIKKHDN